MLSTVRGFLVAVEMGGIAESNSQDPAPALAKSKNEVRAAAQSPISKD
jgi:hypothetical protein